MRPYSPRFLLLATAGVLTALPAVAAAEESHPAYVACDARVKDIIYVSPASKWNGDYYRAWTLALAAVGGDWRNNQGCDTGDSKAEVEAKVREHARRRYTDSPPVEVLGWALEPGYKAPAALPPKPASEGYLVVTGTGAAERNKIWNDTVLQAQREEAARQVRTAIATADQKAKNEALTQKMLGEMRKRGRAQ